MNNQPLTRSEQAIFMIIFVVVFLPLVMFVAGGIIYDFVFGAIGAMVAYFVIKLLRWTR